MLNKPMSPNQDLAIDLPFNSRIEESSGINKVLKFIFYSQTSPHEAMIVRAFYQSAGIIAKNREHHAKAVCYQYGIGRDYLDHCLAKVRVFNSNAIYLECGMMYQIIDPCQGLMPTSNVVRYIAVMPNDSSLPLNKVRQVLIGQWRCADCEAFIRHGSKNNEADMVNF